MSILPRRTRVLLLYDELESGVYATEFFDHITQMLQQEIPLKFDIWNFESLHLKVLRDSVYDSALNADIIAFAVKEDHPIADWILEWCRRWLPHKQAHFCALIGILVNPDDWSTITPDGSNLKQLRELAEEGKLDFFTHETFLTDPIAI
jgi:hypothetical protein